MIQRTRRQFLQQAGVAAGAVLLSGCFSPGARARSAGDELGYRSAVDLAARMRKKEIGSVELTRYFIDRIEKYDETINAVVVRDFERALDAARSADQMLASGRLMGPLHGLPMTIKESYDIAGLPTTWGIPQAAGNVAGADALVVERLKRAGAHFLGKTNVPIGLGDYQSYNEIYGTTNNPWDLARTPGGSSGGAAAALATGLTGLDCGSDIGGSIRNPAHFCGVYGHKPTLGIIPMRGHQPIGTPPSAQDPDLAVGGPLARSAEDLAVALDIMAGPDFLRSPGWRLELPAPRMTSLAGLRVALWPDDPIAPVASEMAARVRQVGAVLRELGAKVSDTARPDFAAQTSHDTYLPILDGMTGGPDSEFKFSEYLELHGQRGGLRAKWQQFFRDWDLLICPIAATPAFVQDQSEISARTLIVNGEPQPYFQQLFWAGIATLSYLPSTVFPTGPSSEGLPIGLQAIGAEFDDRTTIEFARLMARETGGFQAPTGYG